MTRVLICADRVGAAGPVDAANALGRAFQDAAPDRVQVAAVPMAAAGADLRDALAALGCPARLVSADDPADLGKLVAEASTGGGRVLVDLTPLADAGVTAAFDLMDALDRCGLGMPAASASGQGAPVREIDMLVAVPQDQASDGLLGVQGVAARLGYARGLPVAEVLAQDGGLAALADKLGVPDAPGLGAAGGLPLVLAAWGGRPESGFELCRRAAGLDATVGRADLVVVGTDEVTIGNFGGPVLIGMSALASGLGIPCAAVARTAEISARELRRHGVESVHPLGGPPELAASDITRRAAAIAAGWLR